MIPVWFKTQNNIKNMQKKWHKIVENTPITLTKKLIVREFE